MKYKEIQASSPYELSPHRHAFINPYEGCSMGCPFCFWLSMDGWEGTIAAKVDIASVLEQGLNIWPKEQFIYLGSICDPFNEIEEKYGLSGQCLEVIEKYQIPLLITTSAVNEVILERAQQIKQMSATVITVVELARISEIEAMKKGRVHRGIEHANKLREMGLEVWATLAPICPGIIELEHVLERLDPEIPVYIDALQCNRNSIQEKRIMEWIIRDYPEQLKAYERIVLKKDISYFSEILKKYEGNPRICTFPYKLDG